MMLIHSSRVGTVKGSILGPILIALFFAPFFDLAKMTMFVDDTYILQWNEILTALAQDRELTLELVMK